MQAAEQQTKVFRRLWLMLRPHWGMIALAMVFLFISMPGELFPAFIWQYVTDDLVLKNSQQPSGLGPMISLGGRITETFHLLLAALVWLASVYTITAVTGAICTIMLQRIAQKFVFTLRNLMYHKLQSQSLGYLQRQRTGDLMSRTMGDVDELQNFVVNAIDMIIGDGCLWIATV